MKKPTLIGLQKEIELIKERNVRVENDKAWETSVTRKISILFITYAVVFLFLYSIGANKPLINSIVPAIGFYLSTLSLSIIKEWWLKSNQK